MRARATGRAAWVWASLYSCLATSAWAGDGPGPRPGEAEGRRGDEILVCGQLYHTTAPVVLWIDPGGYDAYRVERRFVPLAEAGWKATEAAGAKSPVRFATRTRGLSPEEVERVRGGGWDLPTLRKSIDQFVIHFDARGTSRTCFEILHDVRGLSVHFMLDVDGTIYQTLDVKEGAYHATKANQRSIGIEVANIGAHPAGSAEILSKWYAEDDEGKVRLTIPGGAEALGVRNAGAVLRPSRPERITGEVQGAELVQYDYTPEQYESLARLTATLCTIFPSITCDYPRDGSGQLIRRKLPDADYDAYRGLLGHYHVQSNKVDPGPAFDWDRLVNDARRLMGPAAGEAR